ncbi:hypothetical protein L9F63_014704 [Diploptera punctata]|uniref:Pre-rRNA-processing protein TSR2 homolog n=1 Tax=Diploptera punctata TaxID=6984 RepID=A0AAD8A7Z3_DIPPU|nr:hypothetical protein L9F63_014704 [Diploptera punctata]
MAEINDVFRNAVESVLNSWTGLKLAVEHDMGGFQSKDVALQLVTDIVDIFDKNASIGVEDVADYLTDFMDSEFQTICEDNSPDEVAAVLWQFYQLCKTRNLELVNLELSKLPKCDKWLFKPQRVQQQNVQPHTSDEDNNMDTEDPEWTEVKSRRRKENVTTE